MSNGSPPAHRRLPLLEIVWGAFALPWHLRRELVRVAFMPLLAVMLGWFVLCVFGSDESAFFIVTFQNVAYAWLAISIHRLVLLGEEHARAGLFRDSGLRRLCLCVAVGLGLWILFYLVDRLLLMIAVPLLRPYVPAPAPNEIDPIYLVAGWLAWWPVARFTMLLPAIAIDRPVGLLATWNLSRGNSWKLVLIVCALPYLLEKAMKLVYGDRFSMLQAVSASVVFACIVVISLVANSLAFRQLTAPAPPPTDPPA